MRKIQTQQKKINFIILLNYFLLSIANIHDFVTVKYPALVIMIGIIGYKIITKGMSQKKLTIFFIVWFFFTIEIPFQDLSISQMVDAELYYVTLLLLTLFGEYLFQSAEDYLSCGIGVLAALLFGLLRNPSLLRTQLSGGGSRQRVFGTFDHPNAMGSMVLICLLAFICYLALKEINSKKIWTKLLIFSVFAGCLFLVILSNSRGYSVLYITAVVVWLMRNVEKTSKSTRCFLYGLIGIAVIFVAYYFWIYYASQDASYMSRVYGMQSINMEGFQYYFGYGMVSSQEIDYSVIETGSMEIAWVKMMYKVGILGVVLFAFLLFHLFRQANKLFKGVNTKRAYMIKYAFYTTFATFLMGSLVESSLVTIFNVNPLFMWPCLASLPYAAYRRKN